MFLRTLAPPVLGCFPQDAMRPSQAGWQGTGKSREGEDDSSSRGGSFFPFPIEWDSLLAFPALIALDSINVSRGPSEIAKGAGVRL